ncbi:MAG: hypothetical protein EBR10_04225 [Planctomycetes bacterium]|nr:hypothetical protein [Planctomycetota bacterium]
MNAADTQGDSRLRASATPSLTSTAVGGTLWTSGQAILNKGAVLVATWAIAFRLSEDDIALASLVTVLTKFFCVLPPLNMGDVLVSRGASYSMLASTAARVALRWSILVVATVVLCSPLIALVYKQFPFSALSALLGASLFRVLAEALQVTNVVALRMQFRYRTIAMVDGTLQLGGSVLSVALAFMGAAAWAIVLPISVVAIAKAVAYRLLRSGPQQDQAAVSVEQARGIARDFRVAGFAQYVHSVVDTLPILMLGHFGSQAQTGLYAFAFNLAAQANAVLGGQLSGVLQPVLVQLAHDTQRQVNAFLRTLRVLSAVVVPICLCQAVFSQSLFNAVFPDRWQPAVPVFEALSVSEAFFFASAPTMALLRAQGRFGAFLGWQLIHALALGSALPLVAASHGALGVAVLGTLLWAISLPIAVWMCVRPTGHALSTVVKSFAAPWLSGLPLAALATIIGRELGVFGIWGDAVNLVLVAPATLAAMLLATRLVQPDVFAQLRSLSGGAFSGAFTRVKRFAAIGRGKQGR